MDRFIAQLNAISLRFRACVGVKTDYGPVSGKRYRREIAARSRG
jgi:hypothetical protein